MSEIVELYKWSLGDLFRKELNIPDYQRIYCWTEKNVIQLLDDIRDLKKEYRLGTIILQEKDNALDIIDGQQRLVTLTLLLKEMKNLDSPLLKSRFEDDTAQEYLSYNSYLIHNYYSKYESSFTSAQDLTNKLTFNVLKLNDSSLDLAYTFFSNENSKGCPLSDFDLLKAHHLRYINVEEQSRHLSKRWDDMLLSQQDKTEKSQRNYERTLGLYIFRLRKWLNFELWDENEKYKVKNEYEAAKIYEEIPPFGEQFNYKEPIQGGSHFFAYVSRFIDKYESFINCDQFKLLHERLTGESHDWFKDTIESLLFAYYLKFGQDYMAEVLVLIIRIISASRYNNARIYRETIFECAMHSKITNTIDKATSPTFVIAQLLDQTKLIPLPAGYKGIRERYRKITEDLIVELKKLFILKNQGEF